MNYFTIKLPLDSNQIKTPCHIAVAADNYNDSTDLIQVDGLWDTGSTHTSISQNVIDALELEPTEGKEMIMQGLGESQRSPTYKICVFLSKSIIIGPIDAPLVGNTGHDLIIGMDIISVGDFVHSKDGENSYLSFRVPSTKLILGHNGFVVDSLETPGE